MKVLCIEVPYSFRERRPQHGGGFGKLPRHEVKVGELYEVIEEHSERDVYIIEILYLDAKYNLIADCKFFKTIDEIRDDKINEILN